MKKILLAFICSYVIGLLMFTVTNKMLWHSHVTRICEWNGPVRGLDHGAWTHRDKGLTKDKTKEQKAERCTELGFRPKF